MAEDRNNRDGKLGEEPAGVEEEDYFNNYAEYDESEEKEKTEAKIELLSFGVSEEEYAFPIAEVSEIIKYQAITVIPRCPDYILGIISLRGEIIPIFDLNRRLGLGDTSLAEEPIIIIVHSGTESAGFLVERIMGILKVTTRDFEVTPEVVSPEKAEYFKGVVRFSERLATVLNIERLLDMSEDFKAGPSQAEFSGKGA